jgi:hypothetical protein
MARYIPTDDMSRFLAREFIAAQMRKELERGRVTASIGELETDGTCRVSLLAAQVEFYFRTMLDDAITGVAWIDENSYRMEYEFPGERQPYTFLSEHGL